MVVAPHHWAAECGNTFCRLAYRIDYSCSHAMPRGYKAAFRQKRCLFRNFIRTFASFLTALLECANFRIMGSWSLSGVRTAYCRVISGEGNPQKLRCNFPGRVKCFI